MDNVFETTKERHNKMNVAMKCITFLEEFKYEISNDECQEKHKTLQMPHKLSFLIDETGRTLHVEPIRTIRELRTNQSNLETEVIEITEMLPIIVSKYHDLEITVEADKVNEIKTRQDTYNRHEKIFNFKSESFRILTKVV